MTLGVTARPLGESGRSSRRSQHQGSIGIRLSHFSRQSRSPESPGKAFETVALKRIPGPAAYLLLTIQSLAGCAYWRHIGWRKSLMRSSSGP
jgi:hypothetical protein